MKKLTNVEKNNGNLPGGFKPLGVDNNLLFGKRADLGVIPRVLQRLSLFLQQEEKKMKRKEIKK